MISNELYVHYKYGTEYFFSACEKFREGRIAEAAQDCRKAIEAEDGRFPEAHYSMAQYYWMMRIEMHKAAERFHKALEDLSNLPIDVQLRISTSYVNFKGNYEDLLGSLYKPEKFYDLNILVQKSKLQTT